MKTIRINKTEPTDQVKRSELNKIKNILIIDGAGNLREL